MVGRIEGDRMRVALTGGMNRPVTPYLTGRIVPTADGSAVVGDIADGRDNLRWLRRMMMGVLILVWMPLTTFAAVVDFWSQPAMVLLPLWGLLLMPLWSSSFHRYAKQHDDLAAEMVGRLASAIEGHVADADPASATS